MSRFVQGGKSYVCAVCPRLSICMCSFGHSNKSVFDVLSRLVKLYVMFCQISV